MPFIDFIMGWLEIHMPYPAYEAILSYIPRLNVNMAFEVSPIEEKKGFDWIPFASAALGGAASITASVVAFKLSNASNEKAKKDEEKRLSAMAAMSGYFKILHCVNTFSNVKLHIDDSYRQAHESGFKGHEPYQYVAPSVGRFFVPEKLKSEEFSFLLLNNEVDVINNIDIIVSRAFNTLELLDKYSELRLEMMSWVNEIPELERVIDGANATDIIPTKYKSRFEAREIQLNLLLWGIIEDLDGDRDLSIKTIEGFVDSAHKTYSPYFPKITMATKEPERSTLVVFEREPKLF